MAYDFNLPGGVQVAMGDVNGDGYADIITTPGAAVPIVSVFDGRSLATGNSAKFAEFLFYPLECRIGVNISAGDVDGDGFADILGGASSTVAHVRVVSGRALSNGDGPGDLVNMVTADGVTPGGSRIAAVDADGDGKTDLVTTSGIGNGGRVSMYAAPADDSATKSHQFYEPLPGLASGMYVG